MYKNIVISCICLFFGTVSLSVNANSLTPYYKTIMHILHYSSLPKNSTICVFDNVQATQGLDVYFKQLKMHYHVLNVNTSNFLRSNCQVVYFTHQAPKIQNDWINRYPASLLSISMSNPQCEIGSAVCLSQNAAKINVAFNLDTLSRSKVRIDPRVLKLASGK